MFVRRFFCLAGLAALTCFFGGCGGDTNAVRGTVKYSDGTPVTAGTVVFTGEKFSATGEIKPDGSYEMGSMQPGDGVPPGTYKVTLGGDALGSTYEKKPPLVDKKYGEQSTSGLEVTVENSAKDFPIVVEKPQ